jgi:hypothetical protein
VAITQGMIDGAREGGPVDEEQLSQLEKIVFDMVQDLGREKEELSRLRSLLKWVLPTDSETKH